MLKDVIADINKLVEELAPQNKEVKFEEKTIDLSEAINEISSAVFGPITNKTHKVIISEALVEAINIKAEELKINPIELTEAFINFHVSILEKAKGNK